MIDQIKAWIQAIAIGMLVIMFLAFLVALSYATLWISAALMIVGIVYIAKVIIEES